MTSLHRLVARVLQRPARSRRVTSRRRSPLALLLAASLGLLAVFVPQTPALASSFVRLGGDGSSFAAPAIDQWSTDVVGRGINIDYSADGSAAGRTNYIENQADFAGSDIQFLTTPDPFGGGIENTGSLAYSYIPIVAGGTAFMYNLKVGNRKITDLRLSGLTIAKIFTGQIRNWDDKAITHDYGAALPAQPITVITRSDGSGASYQFTRYLSKVYPSVWSAFCASHHAKSGCGPTEFFPGFSGSQQKNGSDQVANYVASSTYGEGSIAYDEYSYAKSRNLPVVKLLNAAGYYSEPSPSNVAIALQSAVINENERSKDFLIQDLDKVYTSKDPRTYPVSSYSYLIVPRDKRAGTDGPPQRFTTDKGKTLSTWLNYVLCGAQQSAGTLGYSPLPKNLVVGGFKQVLHIPGHVGVPNLNKLAGCNNPTYSDGVNHLITGAPQPSPCDKIGSPLNCVVVGHKAKSNGSQSPGTGRNSSSTGGGGNGNGTGGNGAGNGTGGTGAGNGTGGTGAGNGTGGNGASTGKIDPVTGVADTANGTNVSANGQAVYASPVSLSNRTGGNTLYAILTALELLAAVLTPAVLGIWLQRRRRADT